VNEQEANRILAERAKLANRPMPFVDAVILLGFVAGFTALGMWVSALDASGPNNGNRR
jgi:hypothetical protein